MLTPQQREVIATAFDAATQALRHLQSVLRAYEADLVDDDTPEWFKRLGLNDDTDKRTWRRPWRHGHDDGRAQ